MARPAAIASRTFELGQRGRVEVSFFAPVPDGNDWHCEYRIEWPERSRDHRVFGGDSLQALILAMKIVQAELTHAPEALAEGLTWLGEADLGLPSIASPGDFQS